jgi:pyruvate/2-oxoglutarate dehydrogenase complex dihydrolipoamide acyltransferase (E2) component
LQSLPSIIRRIGDSWYSGNPKLRKKVQGTVGITSVGNILGSQTGMWGCPIVTGMFPLMLGISGISRKPGIVGEKIEPREFLSMSVMLDHYAVDGAEAARFLRRLGELFTQAYGLKDGLLTPEVESKSLRSLPVAV